MQRSEKRVGYAVAIGMTLTVLLIRTSLNGVLAEQARLMPFVLAVTAAAWWGGFGPGLLATILGTLLGVYFIVPPDYSLHFIRLADWVNAGLFMFLGVTISWLSEELHRARRNEVERQFHTLADSIAQLVWMARPDGYRFWFNQRWFEYSGATHEQVEGNAWQAFCDPAELPRVLKSWNDAVVKGEPWEDTYPLRRKDGQMRWHLGRAVPVRDERGDITCWFGTSTDIHDRITSEQALKDADVRKNQFLATLAHELRNPLSPVSNALQLWPHVANDPVEMEHLRAVMLRQVQQLIRLIDDLMDMARIARDKIMLRRSPIDMGMVIAGAVETVQPLIDSLDHHLTVVTPDEPVFVHGDASRLTQVYSNILNNAAKYTPRGGVISITLEHECDHAVVRVRDNGSGIPKDQLDLIFDAFRQVDRTLNRSQGGLGIGLTLVKQLVELHGGTVVAHSAGPGHGSEFVVMLPALAASPLDDPSMQFDTSISQLPQHHVLVVDDLEASAETLAKLLRAIGQDATSVYNGHTAIEWSLEHHPDLVILDIAMPGLDGYEVARRLRQHPELSGTTLVALTGYGQRNDRRQAMAAGFDFHLTKPVNLSALEDLLRKLPDPAVSAGGVSREN